MYDWKCPKCNITFGSDKIEAACPNCSAEVKNEIDKRQVEIFKQQLRDFKKIKESMPDSKERRKLILALFEEGKSDDPS